MYIIVEEFAYTKGNYREILGTIKSCLALLLSTKYYFTWDDIFDRDSSLLTGHSFAKTL